MFKKITCTIFLFTFIHTCYAVDKIVIIGLFKDKVIIKLDGKQRLMASGETSPEGVTLISANSREAVLEINGVRDHYNIGAHIGSRFRGPTGQKTVSIAADSQGMYWVNGSINDFQVKFIVDTGSTLISMNKHQARRIGLDYKMEGEKSLTSTASGMRLIFLGHGYSWFPNRSRKPNPRPATSSTGADTPFPAQGRRRGEPARRLCRHCGHIPQQWLSKC